MNENISPNGKQAIPTPPNIWIEHQMEKKWIKYFYKKKKNPDLKHNFPILSYLTQFNVTTHLPVEDSFFLNTIPKEAEYHI